MSAFGMTILLADRLISARRLEAGQVFLSPTAQAVEAAALEGSETDLTIAPIVGYFGLAFGGKDRFGIGAGNSSDCDPADATDERAE